jgi:beta-hydroxylase
MKIYNYNISKSIFIILIILMLLSLCNIYRLISFLFFPNKNNNIPTSKILEYINYEIFLGYISWFSYLFIFIILIYINLKQTKSIFYKILFTIIFILFIYLPVFPILNILNIILIFFLNNPPFINDINKEFPYNKLFENNYKSIKKEFNDYNNIYKKKIDCFRNNNPLLSNIDSIDNKNNYCWRTIYLKKTGKLINDKIKYFPNTFNLIKDEQIHNAFFSILDPHVEIKPHTGYYKGYLRYHLGINIPEENGKKPYIICGNQKYEWKEGKGVLFDDMYLHYVNNNTNQQRVVLYLDIKRTNINENLKIITDFGNYLSENSYVVKLFIKNQHLQDKI